jgi:hypothetical protein
MRNKWVFSILATGVLALGIFGGTVLAQDSGSSDTSGDTAVTTSVAGGGLLERVAGKLGIAEEDLRTAFDEARSELKSERLVARIDALVADGTLTAEEGTELLAWFESRPTSLDGIGFGRRGGGHHGFGFGGGGLRFGGGGFHFFGIPKGGSGSGGDAPPGDGISS